MGAVIRAVAQPTLLPCPYCGKATTLVYGAQLQLTSPGYRNRLYWACLPCAAWVGCHTGSARPYGTPANARLRKARARTHAVFDLIWQPRGGDQMEIRRRRQKAYRWLAQQLGIATDDCHIGALTLEQCERAIEVSQQRLMANKRRHAHVIAAE
jgi:hypothetical protein